MILALLESGQKGLLQTLGINVWVLGTQVVIFVFTFLVLSNLLFKRVLRGMQEREEEIEKGRAAIDRERAELAKLTKEYEAHLARIDREAYEKSQALVTEALKAAATTVANATTRARDEVLRAVQEISAEKKAARAKVREDVTRLAIEVVEKALDTRLDAGTHGALVRKFVSERP
jgi:F-type H+-transporting ATPase subunit b